MSDSSLTTFVSVMAGIVGTIAAIIGILVIFRPGMFARPRLALQIGWGPPPDSVPKRYRRLPVSHFVFAPKNKIEQPLIGYLQFSIKNSSREPLKNVRVAVEYDKRHLVTNHLFRSLMDFEPTVAEELNTANTKTVLVPSLTDIDKQKIMEERQVSVAGDRAQVSFEAPLIRFSETMFFYDLLWLTNHGPMAVDKSGFAEGGYTNILKGTRNIGGLLDHFIAKIIVFAENHRRVSTTVSILRFASDSDVEEGIDGFGKALWFGRLPAAGFYFSNPITRAVRRKLKSIGRRGASLKRYELGLIRSCSTAELTIPTTNHQAVNKVRKELPEDTIEEYFIISVPNCDYHNLPSNVGTFEELMDWLGSPPRPTLRGFKVRNSQLQK